MWCNYKPQTHWYGGALTYFTYRSVKDQESKVGEPASIERTAEKSQQRSEPLLVKEFTDAAGTRTAWELLPSVKQFINTTGAAHIGSVLLGRYSLVRKSCNILHSLQLCFVSFLQSSPLSPPHYHTESDDQKILSKLQDLELKINTLRTM